MPLPAFASAEQLALRVPGGIAVGDTDRADAALEDASALIRAEAGKTWSTDGVTLDADLPDVIVTVTIAAARRAFTNPEGVASETVPDYSRTFASSSTSADIYLTRGEKKVVLRAAGRLGLWTQTTTRAVDDIGDIPAVVNGYALASGVAEEIDPFSEGWTG